MLHPIHLRQCDLVAPPVVDLGRAGGGVFQRAAVLEVGGHPGRAETVVADAGCDPGGLRAAACHGVGVGMAERRLAEVLGFAADGAEQGRSWFGHAALFDIGHQIFFELMMAGHFVPLAALFMQAQPEPPFLHEHILALHR